jgi:hypothetical protein
LFNRDMGHEPTMTRDLKRRTEQSADLELQIVPSNYQHIGARGNQEDSFAFSDLKNKREIEKAEF